MNEDPELGSMWKGRILMQIVALKADNPYFKVQSIPANDIILSQ